MHSPSYFRLTLLASPICAKLLPARVPSRSALLLPFRRPDLRLPLGLARRDAYLPGVQALYRSLRLVACRHPLIVMHTHGVR